MDTNTGGGEMRVTDLRYEAEWVHGPCDSAISWRIKTYNIEEGWFDVLGSGTAPTHALAWAAASDAVNKILEANDGA